MKDSIAYKKAAELLYEKGWTQRTNARDVTGAACAAVDSAVSYCAFGAVLAVTRDRWDGPAGELNAQGVERWNDAPERTRDEVATYLLFESALAKSEGR